MSFMNKINPPKANAEEKKVNPLLAKKNPFALASKKKESKPEIVITALVAEEPKKKAFPLLKKEIAEVQPTPAVTKEQEATVDQPDAVKTSTEVVDAAKTTTLVDTINEENVETDEQPKVESKRGGNRRGGKTADSKKTETATENKSSDVSVEIPTTTMSYTDAIASIISPFQDAEWVVFRDDIKAKLGELIIVDDMNASTMKLMISELDVLRQEIWFSYQEKKSLFDMLTGEKPCGIIERYSRLNIGNGNNDMERKKAGIIACMNHKTNEGSINLYELMDETRIRYEFLKEVMESIRFKTNALITMSASLKLEKDHTMRGDNL